MRWITLVAMWVWLLVWVIHGIQIVIDWTDLKSAIAYYREHNVDPMFYAAYSYFFAYWLKHEAIDGDM